MSERSVRLDMAATGLAEHQASQSGAEERNPADDEQVARFRRALADGSGTDGGGTAREVDAAVHESGHARGAFGLFGRGIRSGGGAPLPDVTAGLIAGASPFEVGPQGPRGTYATEEPVERGAPGDVWKLADEMAERILVSADGSREVRVAVRDDVMAGVELRMVQEQGRWVVEFVVTDAMSFELLERAGGMIADELAKRLRSGVEVRLKNPTDRGADDEPVCTFFADAPGLSGGAG